MPRKQVLSDMCIHFHPVHANAIMPAFMTHFFVPVNLVDLSLSIHVRCVCECEKEGSESLALADFSRGAFRLQD